VIHIYVPICIHQSESKSQTLLLELDSLKAEVAAAEEAVVAAEKALKESNDIESNLQMKIGNMKARYDDAKMELEEIEKKMALCSSSLKRLGKEKASIIKKSESAQLAAKKSSIKLSKHDKDTAHAEDNCFHAKKIRMDRNREGSIRY